MKCLPSHFAGGACSETVVTSVTWVMLRSRVRLRTFVDLDGKARAHPGADPARIALLWMGKDGKKIPPGTELVTGYFNASSGAEFGAVAASLTNRLVDNYLTLSHLSPSLEAFLCCSFTSSMTLARSPLLTVSFFDLRVEQANRPLSLSHPDHILPESRWQFSEGR
mgnify:CR=1 FL=1